jgi:hypothetical protein
MTENMDTKWYAANYKDEQYVSARLTGGDAHKFQALLEELDMQSPIPVKTSDVLKYAIGVAYSELLKTLER